MHPALSVIFFTVVSGMGYGVLCWAAIGALLGASARAVLVAVALGAASATAGLLSSLGHLGKPGRAWRAFSQWRSSWLSREGIAAVVTYIPAVLLGLAMLPGQLSSRAGFDAAALSAAGSITAVALAVLSLVTVACTAMIYASLRPIPAWRHGLVVPAYIVFALLTGGLVFGALQAGFARLPTGAGLMMLVGCIGLALIKQRYWRDLRERPFPVTRGSAVGLPERDVAVFERPHTEGNFVTREMVFVLARRHAGRLRSIALVLFAVIPALLVLPTAVPGHAEAMPWLTAAAVSALAGAFVERWLFFAEARHTVSLYY